MHRHHQRTRFLASRLRALPIPARNLLVVLLFGVVGFITLQLTHAATLSATQEAEAGTLAGNASVNNSGGGASGNQSVAFGSIPQLPTIIKAATGGTSIALVWNASKSLSVTSYEIYRNNVKVAVVTPNNNLLPRIEKEGRCYIDTNVTRGTTYNYQIKAVANNGNTSPLSAVVSATHPTKTSPIPAVQYDYSAAPAPSVVAKASLEAALKETVEVWYPKISDMLAYPNYTPSVPTITFKTDPTTSAAAAGGGIIYYNPDWINGSPNELQNLTGGTIMHEMTHLVNSFNTDNKPAWLQEGIANWIGLGGVPVESDKLTWPAATPLFDAATLNQGYDPGASFIYYIQTHYKASFPRDISIAVHNNTYTSNYLKNAIGKTEDQIIQEMRTADAGTTAAITGVNGKCMTVANGATASQTPVQISTCTNANSQQWTPLFTDGEDKNPNHGNTFFLNNYKLGVSNCLDIQWGATSAGTPVWYYSCNYGVAQKWQVGPGNSLINPNSGKCLSTSGSGSADGTQLVIADCDGSASQRWIIKD